MKQKARIKLKEIILILEVYTESGNRTIQKLFEIARKANKKFKSKNLPRQHHHRTFLLFPKRTHLSLFQE